MILMTGLWYGRLSQNEEINNFGLSIIVTD